MCVNRLSTKENNLIDYSNVAPIARPAALASNPSCSIPIPQTLKITTTRNFVRQTNFLTAIPFEKGKQVQHEHHAKQQPACQSPPKNV